MVSRPGASSRTRGVARLHHSNIVPIFGAGEEAGLLYFAMPLLNGVTLSRGGEHVASGGIAVVFDVGELLLLASTKPTRSVSIGSSP